MTELLFVSLKLNLEITAVHINNSNNNNPLNKTAMHNITSNYELRECKTIGLFILRNSLVLNNKYLSSHPVLDYSQWTYAHERTSKIIHQSSV